MTRKQLLDRALAAVGGDEAELAQRLGIKNVNSAATEFNRYRRGESMKFERTMTLLRIAGLLREEPVRPVLAEEEVASLLQAIADALERLAHAESEPAQPRSANGT